jgi:hypothetical protein
MIGLKPHDCPWPVWKSDQRHERSPFLSYDSERNGLDRYRRVWVDISRNINPSVRTSRQYSWVACSQSRFSWSISYSIVFSQSRISRSTCSQSRFSRSISCSIVFSQSQICVLKNPIFSYNLRRQIQNIFPAPPRATSLNGLSQFNGYGNGAWGV